MGAKQGGLTDDERTEVLDGHDPEQAMGKRKMFLAQWREYRGLTQEKLGALMNPPTSGSNISRIETGTRSFTHEKMKSTAKALGTTPGAILDRDPRDQDTHLINAVDRLTPAEKTAVSRIIEALVELWEKEGSHG